MVEKKSQRFELSNLVRFGYVPSPAEVVQDELEARGWPLADFAERMGWDLVAVKVFFRSGSPIGDEMASKLGKVFGSSADFWRNLDFQFQMWKKDRI